MPQAGINDGEDGQSIESTNTRGNGSGEELSIRNRGGDVQEVENRGTGVSGLSSVQQEQQEESSEVQNELSESKFGELTDEVKIKILNEHVKTCLESGLLSFNGYSIKKEFPKSFEKISKFMERISQGALIDEDTVIGAFLAAPRSILYTFFDEEKMYVNITGEGYGWQFIIWGHNANELTNHKGFDSRVLAEVSAFNKAFEILEKRS